MTAEEEDIYAFPQNKPTAQFDTNLSTGTYEVPVYLYVYDSDEASMGNGALTHTASIDWNQETGKAVAHVRFHDMPFMDAVGHLEKLWYYDADNTAYEVTAEETEWIINDETMNRVNTLRQGCFELPALGAETVVRVRVDAMGDSEQRARMVFDWANIKGGSGQTSPDTTFLEEKLAEAEAIDNSGGQYTSDSFADLENAIEYARTVLAATEATQEEIDGAADIVQNGMDNLIPCVTDKSALQALADEAGQYSNDDGRYT